MPDPLLGGKGWGDKNGFHTRKSIRAGNGVELAAQSGGHVFKNSSLGVISKLQSAEGDGEDLTNSSG